MALLWHSAETSRDLATLTWEIKIRYECLNKSGVRIGSDGQQMVKIADM